MFISRKFRFVVLLAFAACGGNVVFESARSDHSEANTAGGGGSEPVHTSATGEGGYFIPTTGSGCLLEPPQGLVSDCGSTPSDADGQCVTKLCDSKGNIFISQCLGKHCTCRWNGHTPCECDTNEGDFCGEATSCCH